MKTEAKMQTAENKGTNSNTKERQNKKNKNYKIPKKAPTDKKNSHDVVFQNIKKAFIANEKIQKARLNPHYKLNLNSKASIKVTPLGGLGEIGGNITIFETNDCAIIVDVGMSFPTEDMHGVDILVPDFTYIRQIKNKIKAIVITHAHEDHIGAVAYLFKELQYPIYATPLALGMLNNKFDEHKIVKYKTYFREVEKRKTYEIGEFFIEWIHVTHSIVDCSCLAITTEAGTIIHTGDFKIDHTPIDGYPTDIQRLAYYGEKGVMLLMSDSTNSHTPGFTKSEASVGPTFDILFKNATGRIIMSTFSSNIHRLYQAIKYGLDQGRKICVIGRSMERNIDIAMNLGYIKLPFNDFIEAHEVANYDDNEILIVTTGSQGETMSALFRMATNEHRHIKIKPTDMIIMSAKAIPGNEASVSSVINHLKRSGATVAYQDFTDIHVSGHAAQEEQKLMLRLTQPKFFLPIHGEYNHIMRHKETAISCGVPSKNILLMQDGDTIEVSSKSMKKIKSVKTGKVFIDNQANKHIESGVVSDRQKLANDGIIMVVLQIDETKKRFVFKPKITTFGLANNKEEKHLSKEIEDIISLYLVSDKRKDINSKIVENDLKQAIKKYIIKKYKKYPLIVITAILKEN